MKKFSIIIPNFNGQKLLQKNLPAVISAAQFPKIDFEILVVDNGSTDNSVEFLKNFKQIKILKLGKNFGFAKACNIAARSAKFPIFILLNNDISPDTKFIPPLLKHFKDPKVFAISSLQKVITPVESFYGGAAFGFVRFGLLRHESLFQFLEPDIKPLNTLYASGGCAAVDKEKFLSLGGFDEVFSPFYWEDADLSWRALKRGWKVLVESQSVVTHRHESTIKRQFNPFYVKTISFRNTLLFSWKHLESLDLIFWHLFYLPFHLLRALLFKWPNLAGFLWAVLKIPQVIFRRFKERKFQFRSDKEILSLSQNKNLAKPRLAILTQAIRRDTHAPLKFFQKIKLFHFYQTAPYGDLTKDELKDAIKYKNIFDLYFKLQNVFPNIIQGAEPYASKRALALSLFAYFISKKWKIPLILPVLENRPAELKFGKLKAKILKKILALVGGQASIIFYYNQGAKKNLIKVGVGKGKLVHLPWGLWGVDTGLFTPNGPKMNFAGRPLILFVGRLEKAKGIKYILDAFLKIKKNIPSAKLVFVGKGILEEQILKFRASYKLADDIILEGVVKNKDLPTYFRAATLTIYPSVTLKGWEEQFGTVNFQSLACGTPVVSTRSGAIPEYVPSGQVGFLIKERNSSKISEAMLKILKSKSLHQKFSHNARQYALSHLDAQKTILKAEKIILKVLEKND